MFEFEFLEHLDEIIFGNSLFAILDFFECGFQLLGILSDHLSDPQKHIFLFLLINKLKLIDKLAQFSQQDFTRDGLGGGRIIVLKTVVDYIIGVCLGEVERFVDEHTFEVGEGEGFLFGLLYVAFELLVRVALGFHAISEELLDLFQDAFVGLVGS